MATQQSKNKKGASAKPIDKKGGDKGGKGSKKKGQGQFSEQYMPYIMGALCFLFTVFFIMCLFAGEKPEEHPAGVFGHWFCKIFFGLFGWTAFLIPVLFLYLTVFWRKNCRENTMVLRTVLTVVLMVLFSAVVHVFVCGANPDMAVLDVPMLFETGAGFASGGVIGGTLGLGLYSLLNVAGTVVISVIVFPLLIMLLVGVTPAYVADKIKAMVAEGKKEKHSESRPRKQKSNEKSRRRAQDEDDEDDASDEDEDSDDGDDSEDAEDDYVPSERNRRTPKPVQTRKVSGMDVDTRTGEVLDDDEDDDEDDDGVMTAKASPRPLIKTYTAEDGAPAAQDADGDGDDSEGGTSLYVPNRRSARERRARRSLRDSEDGMDRIAEEDDGLYSDERHHGTETMEISMNESNSVGGDENSNPRSDKPAVARPSVGEEKERMVVLIREQDHTAVHSTVDNQVDGLADEEVVVPSGTGEAPTEEKTEYSFPPVDLLARGSDKYEADEEEIARNTETLREVLESFHIRVKEVACSCGPTITRFEVKPDQGVRVRAIANLVDDIALGLAKSGVRIEAPIPGKAAVGIEVPTEHPATVYLRNLIESPEFRNHKSRIAACLGADVSGRPVIFDINKMPHLLVAGATGMGKSVCINSIIMSILYKATPDEVKLILIDPKKVEFTMYRDLPHLYAPIVSDPKKAAGCLNSAVNEMERRFELIEEEGVRNITGYNEVIADDPTKQPLPRIVIIIDEFADLMMTASQEVETAVCRLAQKARAAGIHIIIGTQRPSVDVITGLIKANIPSRIAFTVASSRDSMTILDMGGAEKLIGRGDMLYAPVGASKPMRVQGTFVSDGEVERVVTYIKENNNRVAFDENFVKDIEVETAKCGAGKKKGGGDMAAGDFDALGGEDSDEKMFWAAVEVAVEDGQISTSLLQRRLRIGFGKASRYIDRMEDMGFVTPKDGAKPRKTLITPSDLAEIRVSGRTEADPPAT